MLRGKIVDNLVIVAMQFLNLNHFLFLFIRFHGLINAAGEHIVRLPGKGLALDQCFGLERLDR